MPGEKTRSIVVPRALALAIMLLFLPAQAEGGGGTFWPKMAQWRTAFRKAATSPATWAPAGGSAVLMLTGWDEDISEWAVRSTPVFGSQEDASEASDDLLHLTRIALYSTTAAIPLRHRDWGAGSRHAMVSLATLTLTDQTTFLLKSATDRERPDGGDTESFPSGHASAAFANAYQASRNVDTLGLPPAVGRSLKTGFVTLAAGTAWARVEAGRHYPSDVLFSAALSNFITTVLNEAFIPSDSEMRIGFSADSRQAEITFGWRF